ncbi:MAG: cytidylate kinase-like family protein [Lachnospiraceae bacterium]|nr:cytidylate kinase-like family protein [Lachnospiraceae bacterium]
MNNIVITIQRQFGSGGKTIGAALAKELGINFYSREILRMASDDSGIKEELFNEADEKLQNGSIFGVSTHIYDGQLITPDKGNFVSAENLFYYQAKVIKELAEKESCVIVGRCADFVLKDNSNAISVFVHAPKEYCLEKAGERVSQKGKELEKFVAKTDKYRGDYYHYYTGREWEDARNYDLCIDSSKLGFEKAEEVIKEYIKVRFNHLP